MGTPIRVLIVEDSTDDAELVLIELRRAGYDPVSERVQTAEAMKTALESEPWDLVVSDYTMPQFDAPAALNLLNQSSRDIPFIVVSGSIGEDIAVAMMRTGAHDYVLKQNLTRFVSAVQRELREAENRRQQKLTEQAKQQLQIERDELLERLKQENEDLAALTRVTANAISTLELDDLLRVLLERVMEVMHADTATILLAEGDELRVRASVGALNLSDSTHVKRVGQCFAGSVAQRMKPVYVEDATVDPLITDPLIRERGIRSMLGVPLKRNGNLIGVLHADWLAVRPCRDREVHLLEITAERCAAAIQNAQLYEEARRIAAALTESEARLRQLSSAIEQTADAVLITDREGTIEYVNAAFEEISGYTAAEAVGRKPSLLMSGQHRPEFFDKLWRTIVAGEPFRAVFVNRHKSGALVYEEKTITPIRDPGGAITHFVSTAKDVTERRRAEEALRSSLQEKEALLKEVHHRVKNNLQVITSLLRLETGRNEHPSTKSVLRDMQGRVQSMALLHETLYRSGTFASVDLGDYLKQLANHSFRALNAQPGLIQLDLDLASVRVDMDQTIPCGLLVNELISNCLKHGFPGGRTGGIRVELRPVDGGPQLRLRVSDTGVGLPPDFDSKRSHSLGLQLVSDLTRQIGGRLEIEPGPGAVFAVTFKAAEPTAATP
jgi:PAS domain S-box-containing protein